MRGVCLAYTSTHNNSPVGVPETGSVQEVLIWQTCTVRMMYRIVGQALKDAGSEDEPLDYLAFFCLGKNVLQRSFLSCSLLRSRRIQILLASMPSETELRRASQLARTLEEKELYSSSAI